MRKRWVNGGVNGDEDFAVLVKTQRPKLEVEVIKRSNLPGGCNVLPKHWAVERTCGWLRQSHRLMRDSGQKETSATDWIIIAMIRVMLRRLA